MISDVPIGFFLSGGLDSSTIVAMARKSRPGAEMECFSIDTSKYGDYDGFSNDLRYARMVADKFECNLNVIEANSDILNSLERMVWNLDEPQTDPASFHVERISRKAREMGIKVLLGGTGGDDVFSGYRRHQALHYEQYINLLPTYVKKKLAEYGRKVNNNNASARRMGKILSSLDLKISDRLFNYHMWLPKETTSVLLCDNIKEMVRDYDPRELFMNMLDNIPNESSWLNKMLYWEQNGYLVDNNLNYMDKSGMAESIETRVPFLDVELVNFASTLDPDFKLKGKTTKYLLRKVMEQYLPKKIIYRPKTGFGAPVRKWIREDMHEMIHDLLSLKSMESRGIFDPLTVLKLIDLNKKGKIDASYTIWSILNIEIWLKLFVDR
jgi:asparagine synthase (glutamine-hydrolysing)